MQIQITKRYHLIPIRRVITNKLTNECWQGCEERGTLLHCLWECRLFQALWKTIWNYLKKLKIELPYDPATPLLGIQLKKPKTLIQENICTPIFIAALFTIAKIWKQPRCPSVDEQIKPTMVHLHNGILLVSEKECGLTFCVVLDGPGECHSV